MKLFGLTIFELQRDIPEVAVPRRLLVDAVPAKPSQRAKMAPAAPWPWAALHQTAEKLPRTKRGTIDVEASLLLLGIADPSLLWQHRFKPGFYGDHSG